MSSTDMTSTDLAAPAAQVRGLGIIAFRTPDSGRLVRFYKEILGFVEGEQLLEPGVSLEAGDAKIYIAQIDDAATGAPSNGGMRLALVVRGIVAACERLRVLGVTIVDDVEIGSEYFATCSIADPDGNVIELWGQP